MTFKPGGGSGTTEANVPDWEEDPNSPIDSSGAQNHTLSFSSTAETARIYVQSWKNTSGTGQEMEVRLNGDTGNNYFHADVTGSTTNDDGSVPLDTVANQDELSGWITITRLGNADGTDRVNIVPEGLYIGLSPGTTSYGQGRVGTPISSISFRGGTGNVSIKAKAYTLTGDI